MYFMKSQSFLNILNIIKPDQHIIAGRRGSEENVKVKIVLPLVEYLGFDIVKDADFELFGTDIVLFNDNSSPILIIETKAWEQPIANHLNQCLEYMLKLKVPLILITSGQHFSLYSALGNLEGLSNAQPILNFTFNDLVGSNGEIILNELKSLIGKRELSHGNTGLDSEIVKGFKSAHALEDAKKAFMDKCLNFTPTVKSIKINESEFAIAANNHNKDVSDRLLWCQNEFKRIAKENKNISLRYRSKEIGLEYLLASRPRPKILGLVGIYPERNMIAFGLENWKKTNCPQKYLETIKAFPRHLETKEQAVDLINLVETAIKTINSKVEPI